MIDIAIPGYHPIKICHIVMDFNGTIAIDGKIIAGVAERICQLSHHATIHVVTADTFGSAASQLKNLPCKLFILSSEHQDVGKLEYIKKLGVEITACIGNGNNDRLMLQESILGIALIQEEGASVQTILAADVVCFNILSALDLLLNPKRLIATLRL